MNTARPPTRHNKFDRGAHEGRQRRPGKRSQRGAGRESGQMRPQPAFVRAAVQPVFFRRGGAGFGGLERLRPAGKAGGPEPLGIAKSGAAKCRLHGCSPKSELREAASGQILVRDPLPTSGPFSRPPSSTPRRQSPKRTLRTEVDQVAWGGSSPRDAPTSPPKRVGNREGDRPEGVTRRAPPEPSARRPAQLSGRSPEVASAPDSCNGATSPLDSASTARIVRLALSSGARSKKSPCRARLRDAPPATPISSA